MISLGYLFEVIPDSIEYTDDFLTAGPTKVFKAKLKGYQDSQTWGGKLFHKLNPPNAEQDSAFEAAKEATRKRLRDTLPKENWYKSPNEK